MTSFYGTIGKQGPKGDKGEDSDITKKYVDKTFANALIGEKTGTVVKITDASPQKYINNISAIAETEIDFNTVTVKVLGANNVRYPYQHTTREENGVYFTDNGDGSITIKTDPAGATKRTNFNTSGLDKGDYSHLIKGENYTVSCKCDKPQNIKGNTISFTINYYKSTTDAGKYAGWLSCQTDKTATNAYPFEAVGISTRSYISVNAGVIIDEPITVYPQLEIGTTATAFESFVEPVEYSANSIGEAEVTAIYPTTTIITNNPVVKVNVKYAKDINKAFAELQNTLISLGGNV